MVEISGKLTIINTEKWIIILENKRRNQEKACFPQYPQYVDNLHSGNVEKM